MSDGTEKSAPVDIRDFSHVDAAAERFIAFLEEVEQLPWLQAMREESFARLDLAAGQRMVEIGCGPGTAVQLLRAQGIEAVGIDASRTQRSIWPDTPCVPRCLPAEGKALAAVIWPL